MYHIYVLPWYSMYVCIHQLKLVPVHIKQLYLLIYLFEKQVYYTSYEVHVHTCMSCMYTTYHLYVYFIQYSFLLWVVCQNHQLDAI
jgi:Gpi18-like mannosyltransferase